MALLLLLGASLIFFATPVLAQAPELISIKPARSSPPIRSDAPMTFLWNVSSQSPSLVEGQLEVVVHDGPTVRARAVLEDIVLSPGDQLFRTVLPPVESNNPQNLIEVHVEFVRKKRKLASENFDFRAPSQWQRSLAILVCDPWQTGVTPDKQRLIDRLRLETCNADAADRTLTTFPAHVRPEDLPPDSLGYCGYDLICLADEGFAEVKETQLRMILDWVNAGGSLCVVPGPKILKEYHARFLNQAVHSSPDNPRFALDSSGRIMPPAGNEAEARALLLCRCGLGRVALIPGKPDRLLHDHEIDVRRMLVFLWKVRHDRVEVFMNTGTFLVKTEVPVDQPKPGESDWQNYNQNRNVNYAGLRPRDYPLAQLPLQSGDQLLSRLMPQGLQVVPMSLIGLILVVYVALIGPADWLVLGAIKRRKWTWILFPVVTVVLTLATVWLAEWYMQVTGGHRRVTFYDVGDDGRIARHSRFDVLFEGSERFVATDLTREIFTAMTLQRFSRGTWQGYQQAQLQQGDQSRKYTEAPSYIGRVPAHYTVRQFASQWTPQLNRRFTIPPGGDRPVEFDWDHFADPQIFNPQTIAVDGPARKELLESLRKAFPPNATVFVLTGGKRHHLAGNATLFGNVYAPYGLDPYGNPYTQPQYGQPWQNPNAAQADSFLEDASVNSLGGLFAVVSQVSPGGGRDFEDMALVDPSDPDQWLLIVAVDRGDELELYRKLYTKGD
ncbi:MAG: hypothetical protein ACM3U2_13935 [Deltaproteobacteria bacterium]